METALPAIDASERLRRIVEQIREDAGCLDIQRALARGEPATIDGVVGSASALILAGLRGKAPLMVVCRSDVDADALAADLTIFLGESPERFAAWDTSLGERLVYDATYGERMRTLKRLLAGACPPLLVASVQSLMQPVPSAAAITANTRTISVGEPLDSEAFCAWLVTRGYHAASGVELPGEFARRGALLDIFAIDGEQPVRIELFGDEVESIRRFDVGSQRSIEPLSRIELTILPAGGDDPMRAGGSHREHFASLLPQETIVVWMDFAPIQAEAAGFLERASSREGLHAPEEVFRRLAGLRSCEISPLATHQQVVHWTPRVHTVDRFVGRLEHIRGQLHAVAAPWEVYLTCSAEGEMERLDELFRETSLANRAGLHFVQGMLDGGFQLPDLNVIVLTAKELFQRDEVRRQPRRHLGQKIDSFLDLREGDLVVHLGHGIGRYRGMELLRRENQVEEHLAIEFHGGTKLFVPSTKIDLIQKYVGGTKARPRLATIGGQQWQKSRKAAESAALDLAAELLELQARRNSRPGIAFGPDTVWQREFDGSFPYTETQDQLAAIEAIKTDMELSRPMDRLLCGDVGFGKTEVAVRAAFKAIDNGYQVAVLVPTTILAEQHYHTFVARMAEYPFSIARLSRFCSSAEEREILERLEAGQLDLVVGTHRLASPDVKFHNLGLLIIDEEQRFGVEVKERLKALRSTVDVLTTTATPIPRTLHMSLTGMRDISNLETPPRERIPVETRLLRWHDDVIRQAILRELNRGGQVYFVHNRIEDMAAIHAKLRTIVPEASVRVGHGQMHADELEEAMVDFVGGKFDVLLATTIVESGLDIPNANTILIDQADRYGLADLHQLRGRVGRYNRHAFCYLLIDASKPINPQAARRLQALEEFSSLGAGFAIAMRDLEFRGAGNILGAQQSGHIAAVGYEMYCHLLESAVRRLKHLPPKLQIEVNVDLPGLARLPENYVADQRTRIDIYRRLTRIASSDDVRAFEEELRDRFGEPPPEARRLLELAALKVEAAIWQVHTLRMERQGTEYFLVFEYTDRPRIEQLARRTRGELRVVDGRSAYATLHKADITPEGTLAASLRIFTHVAPPPAPRTSRETKPRLR